MLRNFNKIFADIQGAKHWWAISYAVDVQCTSKRRNRIADGLLAEATTRLSNAGEHKKILKLPIIICWTGHLWFKVEVVLSLLEKYLGGKHAYPLYFLEVWFDYIAGILVNHFCWISDFASALQENKATLFLLSNIIVKSEEFLFDTIC